MIEKYAHLFTEAAVYMSEAKWSCVMFEADVRPDGEPVLPKHVRAFGNTALASLKRACIMADLDSVVPQIDRLSDALNRGDTLSVVQVAGLTQGFRHLIANIRDHLDQEFFFHIDGSDAPLYLGAEPFGGEVSVKFPSASEDIAEAAKCLAVQRPTACVFHLMRVAEAGVRVLGKRFRIVIADPRNETWANIIRLVNTKIEGLPTKTAIQRSRKEELASASAYLNAMRIATRNGVMHPKETYTREQAHEVFRATRLFMIHLAGLV
jgi:hypothetical protein